MAIFQLSINVELAVDLVVGVTFGALGASLSEWPFFTIAASRWPTNGVAGGDDDKRIPDGRILGE